MSAPPGTPSRIGPYQLIRLLGVGSIAQVYHAQRRVDGIEQGVALKVPRLSLMHQRGACERFLEQARANARMGPHDNIVTTLDVGVDGELPYLAMEYVCGVDLGQVVQAMRKANLRWPQPAVSWVMAGVLRGLAHAYGASADGKALHRTHRDLKSSHVVITREGQIKLTDFGFAGLVGSAPGLCHGGADRVGPAADMHAAGALAWELLEGQSHRMPESSTSETLVVTRRGPGPRLTRGNVSAGLAELVHGLLDSNEQTRIPHARRALAALEACPDLNLSAPEPLRRLLGRFFGNRQRPHHTIVEPRIHPELVALESTLSPQSGANAPLPPPRSIIVRRRAHGVPAVQRSGGNDDTVPASVDVRLPATTASTLTFARPIPTATVDPASSSASTRTFERDASASTARFSPTVATPAEPSITTATFSPAAPSPPSGSGRTVEPAPGVSASTLTPSYSARARVDARTPEPAPPRSAAHSLPADSSSTPTFTAHSGPVCSTSHGPPPSPRDDRSTGWQPGTGPLTIAPPPSPPPIVGEIVFSDASRPFPTPIPPLYNEPARDALVVPVRLPPRSDAAHRRRAQRWWPLAVALCAAGLALGGFVIAKAAIDGGSEHGHVGHPGRTLAHG
ncbi:MAG: protein kinase [Myxococcota bacterium]